MILLPIVVIVAASPKAVAPYIVKLPNVHIKHRNGIFDSSKPNTRVTLQAGDLITTEREKFKIYSTIVFQDGTTIQNFPGSRVTYLSDGSKDQELVEVVSGTVIYSSPDNKEAINRYRRRVRTPSRTLGTQGTVFQLEVIPGAPCPRNKVTQIKGQLEITNLKDPADIAYRKTGEAYDDNGKC
ncbi:MAG: hypothetical protein ACKVQS_12945 [Fimbriimonadaceae bacterium]